jgi:hypothetical protein
VVLGLSRLERRDFRPLVLNQSKWIEVGVGVKGIGMLGTFEEIDDKVGEWSGENLVDDLEAVVGKDDFTKCGGGIGAEEGEGDNEGGIDSLANDRGADGTGPEPAAAGAHLEAGHGVGVGELACPEGDEAGREQAGKEAEDGDEGLLVVKGWVRGKGDDERADAPHEGGAEEAEPDRAARSGVAVDLGEDVPEDVGDREEDERARDGEGTETDHLLGDQVRDQQDDDEDGDQDVEVTELSRHLG